VEKNQLSDAYLEKNHQIVVRDKQNTEFTSPSGRDGNECLVDWEYKAHCT